MVRLQFIDWLSAGESVWDAMPIQNVVFSNFPAQINFFTILPDMGEIEQSILETLDENSFLLEALGKSDELFHFLREEPLSVGPATAKILVAINVESPLAKLLFQLKDLLNDVRYP